MIAAVALSRDGYWRNDSKYEINEQLQRFKPATVRHRCASMIVLRRQNIERTGSVYSTRTTRVMMQGPRNKPSWFESIRISMPSSQVVVIRDPSG